MGKRNFSLLVKEAKNKVSHFVQETKDYGVRVSTGNALISFTKWYVGAKRITLTYRKNK